MQTLGGRGYVDFYGAEPDFILLELARDSLMIDTHIERFTNPNKYQPMLASGVVKGYAVVDFRSPGLVVPAEGYARHEHLYTVVWLPGFEQAEVWHMGVKLNTIRVAGVADKATREALRLAIP